jgi:hypothetical protein
MGLVDPKCRPALYKVKGKNAKHVKAKFKQLFLKYLKLIMITFVITLNSQPAHSAEVSFAWNSIEGATGYNIYYGFESRNYPFVVDIGLWTQCTVSDLDDGRVYYFAVTAYNESDETEFSEELTYGSDICDADIDIDIDGSDLAGIIEDPSAIALNDFVARFGTENCAN